MNNETQDLSVEEAARWYARLNSPQCTAEDRRAFEAWRRRDPVNGRNFAAARRLAEDLFQTIATDDRLQAMARDALAMGSQNPEADAAAAAGRTVRRELTPRRRWTLAAGFAACLVAAIGGLTALQRPGVVAPAAALYAAGSETRQITLDDGTRVHLDVRSHLEVRYTPARRDVVLTQGRVIFDVAKDPDRPFAVSTAFGVVTALGTRFEVRQTESMIVTLAEGSVTVAGLSADDPREYLQPGEQLVIASNHLDRWVKREVDVDAETGWSAGRLTFRAEPLEAAVAEVNRYATAKVRIADPSLAEMPVSGSFVAGDSRAAVAAFAALLPIRIADGGDELLLFRRWEPTVE